MDIAGLSIAVIHETFTITNFIIDVVSTMKSQSDDFGALKIEFEHHQLYLQTLGKWFITDTVTGNCGAAQLYRANEKWRENVLSMFLELRKLISGYTKLAVKYDPKYQAALEKIENGEWVGVGIGEPDPGHGGLKVLSANGTPVSLAEIFTTRMEVSVERVGGDGMGGFRERLKKRFHLLDWALFNFKRLSELVQLQKKWTLNLRNLMQFALLPGILSDVVQLQSLTTKENEGLGFSRLAETRLAILGQLNLGDPDDQILNVADFIDAKLPGQMQSLGGTQVPPGRSTSQQQPHPRNSNSSDQKFQSRLIPKKVQSGKWQGRIVLVEYKTYQLPEEDLSGIAFEITQDRIKGISRLLAVGHPPDETNSEPSQNANSPTASTSPASLKCIGYFHEKPQRRFGMVFLVPRACNPVSTSLHTLIRTCTRETRPSLGQRFGMAAAIGRALLEWFLVDWVHKSISSLDVNFFRHDQSGSTWEFSSPYLGGFEYARPSQGISNEIYGPWDFDQAIYRHPARQGAPTESFHKHHDIYAFGVLLLEIGLWQVARELFSPADQASKVKISQKKVKDVVVANARKKLGHYMGDRYKDVVLRCLEEKEPRLGVKVDDSTQGKLLEAFKEIVEMLEVGAATL